MTAWKEIEDVSEAETAPKRAAWKEENPEFKAYKHKKRAVEDLEKMAYTAREQRVGLPLMEIWDCIHQRFSDVTWCGIEDPNEENIAAAAEDFDAEYIPDFQVAPEQYAAFIRFLSEHETLSCDFLIQVTAVDFGDRFDVCVHLLSTSKKHKIFVRCSVEHDDPHIDTISHIFQGANWHEREVFDFFGITFDKHPDLRRIFLFDEFEGYPLRKDFDDPTRIVKRPY